MDTTELQELKRRLSSAADFLARNSQETGARAVRAAIPMVVANEVDEQSAVDAIKYLTNLLPWVQNQGGGMSTTAPKLAQAIDVLRALAAIRGRQQYNHILDANKLLNDKCERLMAEVKRLEYVAGDRPDYAGPDTKTGEVVQLKGVEPNPEGMKGIPVLGDMAVRLKEMTNDETERLKAELSAARSASTIVTNMKDGTISQQSEEITKLKADVVKLQGELDIANDAVIEQGSVIRGLKDELSQFELVSKDDKKQADMLRCDLDDEKAFRRQLMNIASVLADRRS